MIYFIQGAPGSPIKIGYAEDPGRRLLDLQIGNPAKLCILGVLPGDQKAERAIHARFADIRISGEWFKAMPLLTDLVKQTQQWEPPEDIEATAQKERAEARQKETVKSFRAALLDAYGNEPDCHAIARDAGVGADTAKAWARGDNVPQLAPMFNLARSNVAMRDWFRTTISPSEAL